MTGVKISNLPAIAAPALTDVFPVSQAGVTYKETFTQLAALLTAPLTGATVVGLQNQQYSYVVDSGAADAYIGIMAPAVTAYVAGQRFDLLISNTNTGASTLVINALAAKAIKRADGTALVAGDLIAGQIATFEYDGTNFQLMTEVRRLLGTTTNNSAVAGYVGEYISTSKLVGAAVALTTNVVADIVSAALSAGDWDVRGMVICTPAAGAVTAGVYAAINTVSAIVPTVGAENNTSITYPNNTASNAPSASVGPMRISLAAPATVYLMMSVSFTVAAMGGYGFIGARRVR